MKRIRTIIIDDEELARSLVKKFLEAEVDIEVVGEFSDGFTGLKAIHELGPDLVFLDVQMPKLNGFEMLELMERQPNIIFTTAYNEYAIKAFEVNAIDYLLKPFSKDRFRGAVQKAICKIKNDAPEDKKVVDKLMDSAVVSDSPIDRIVVKKAENIVVLPLGELIYIESQDDYVMIYTKRGKFLKQKTMKYYEESLPEKEFCRIHRSYIVCLEQIDRLEPYEKNVFMVVMKTGQKLRASRVGYKRLKDVLDF